MTAASKPNTRGSAALLAGLAGLAAIALGCGTGGAPPGGAAGLPGQPIIPWSDIDTRDPCDNIKSAAVLRAEAGETLSNPWALEVDGEVWIYYAVQTAQGAREIRLATSSDGVRFDQETARTVLRATEKWEDGQVGAPAVLPRPEGGFELFYVGGTGAARSIGRAWSADGKRFDQREGEPILAGSAPKWEASGVARPSPVLENGELWLFYGVGDGTAVGLALASGAGGTFERVDGDDSTPGVDAVQYASTRDPILTPTIERVGTPTGRLHLRMWFGHGPTDKRDGVGVSGAFATTGWQRYEANPVLGNPATKPLGPARLDFRGARYLYTATIIDPKAGDGRREIRLSFSGLPGEGSCGTP